MSKKALSGWKRAVVFNPANGDRVQFNKLSPQFSELPDDINIKTETTTGQAFGGKNWPVTVGFMDSDGLALLDTWMAGYTPCNLVIYSVAGHCLLFYEPEEIDFKFGTGIDARGGAKVHTVMIESVGGLPDVKQLKNLAKAITFVGDAGNLIFPLAGIELTLAASFTTPDGATLSITAKSFAGATLASSSQAVVAGRNTVKITLPADTYSLDIDLLGGGTGNTSDVSLRGDGSDEFINY